MFKYEKSVFINRPQQEVFDFVTNLSNDAKWQASIESVRQISDGKIGVGTAAGEYPKFLVADSCP